MLRGTPGRDSRNSGNFPKLGFKPLIRWGTPLPRTPEKLGVGLTDRPAPHPPRAFRAFRVSRGPAIGRAFLRSGLRCGRETGECLTEQAGNVHLAHADAVGD